MFLHDVIHMKKSYNQLKFQLVRSHFIDFFSPEIIIFTVKTKTLVYFLLNSCLLLCGSNNKSHKIVKKQLHAKPKIFVEADNEISSFRIRSFRPKDRVIILS